MLNHRIRACLVVALASCDGSGSDVDAASCASNLGASCSVTETDCCWPVGEACFAGTCCLAETVECGSNEACCSGTCEGGACACTPSGAACRRYTDAPTAEGTCCAPLTCLPTGADPEVGVCGCRETGIACVFDDECCSGSCVGSDPSAGTSGSCA